MATSRATDLRRLIFLLETNVVSDLRRPRPHPSVLSWFNQVDPELLRLPAIVVGEMQQGIERVRAHDPVKAAAFEVWLTEIAASYEVIPMDGGTFRIWAKLMARRQPHLSEDAMIAATAIQHGHVVVSRNAKDFLQFDIEVLNPFEHPTS